MSNRRRASPNAPGGAMGDIVESLRMERHLTPRQYRGWVLFRNDLQASHGTSEGIVQVLGERVQVSGNKHRLPSGGDPIGALEAILHSLRPHERRLIGALVQIKEVRGGTLGGLGRRHSGYQQDKTSRAVVVGRVGALLDTLADSYRVE